jgi:L-threonylcarbamoyladenylate synthase
MLLDGRDAHSIVLAVRQLVAGGLVAFPTETVYGLGANADDDAAVASIFTTKGRPSEHPLIVHVAQASGVAHFANQVPAFAQALMQSFWPGPLTLILPRRDGVAVAAAGGQGSIGLRSPSHPLAQALLRACAAAPASIQGLAAPSANRFGRISPTTAAHVRAELGEALLVLDGGPCAVGIESAIVDCTRAVPVLLRPGVITRAALECACGQRIRTQQEMQTQAPHASGTLQAHYAPQAKLRLMDAQALQTALELLGSDTSGLAVYSRFVPRSALAHGLYRRMPEDAAAAAHQLFAVLRELDASGVRLIWVQTPPPGAEWDGVRDRLERAAAG